jgi:hypothetical protein
MSQTNLNPPKTNDQASPEDKENPGRRSLNILEPFERIGKSFAWVIQIAIALGAGFTGYFAYTLHVNQVDYQEKSLALQMVRDFMLEGRSKDEKFGLACIKRVMAVAHNDPRLFARWWNSKDHTVPLPANIDQVSDCGQAMYSASVTMPHEQNILHFNQQVYREILNALNSYELYLSEIDQNVGNRTILCQELPLSRSSPVYKLIVAWEGALKEPKGSKKKYATLSGLLSEYPELQSYVSSRGVYTICAGIK